MEDFGCLPTLKTIQLDLISAKLSFWYRFLRASMKASQFFLSADSSDKRGKMSKFVLAPIFITNSQADRELGKNSRLYSRKYK